jgi:hypothetical protein
MKTKLFFLVLSLGFPFSVFGDTWLNPKIETYFSEDSSFMLKVFPTEFPDKYMDWKRAKPKKKAKFSPADTAIKHCHAALYKISDSDTTEIWSKRLINAIAPVHAIVANDGNTIVTFDNWHSVGYGIDVLVVYDSRGGLVNRYALEDFSPFPINDYEMTISSLWWRCGASYIDDKMIEICFRDADDNEKIRKYNLVDQIFID